jgi:pyrroline-5-carboxylate reductase
VLGESGMQDALRGKLLISVLAGVTTSSMQKAISGDEQSSENECYVVRALPNLAVEQHASATAIEIAGPELPVEKLEKASAIFQLLGGIVHLPASLMDAATIMCGSTPALIALFLDGLIDGAVAAGVPRSMADTMAAQVLASTAALMQDGQRASALRESVCAMPGCTIQASIALEQGGVRGTAATAMKAAIEAASKLG